MFNVGDKDVPLNAVGQYSINLVRSVLEYLGYKITGSGEDWFEVEDRLVVEYDVTDKVIPFAIADVKGYQLACDHTARGITRSAIYFLESK